MKLKSCAAQDQAHTLPDLGPPGNSGLLAAMGSHCQPAENSAVKSLSSCRDPAGLGEKPPEHHEWQGTPLRTEALAVFVGQEVRTA